ncbi:MAG: hypothetical protein Q9194_003896 [Teloschistes cf. exilis]
MDPGGVTNGETGLADHHSLENGDRRPSQRLHNAYRQFHQYRHYRHYREAAADFASHQA